ncbi:unnamed protein product [Rotaria sp. Silwood1]|nr:unnamed protein product [Rotaria sp. Silwood1]CAF3394960.1 unnamed protein product [Rotaria sp. Silwood1]CAF3418944.1 unnamed protein product [Rotaria sp. Silwood1]CAF4659635.1 unnamed protein product [Rotaria sp. Silwood1]
MAGIQLNTVLSQLKTYAPLYLADQSWDNVGLLVEPNNDNPIVEKLLFTNDLTEPVLDEAIERQVQLIVSYHPPIFSGLKRLTQNNWKERIILKCIKHGITVYSPHTSWDAVDNGINQWLISAFGINEQDYTSRPIVQVKTNETPSQNQHLLTITLPKEYNINSIKNIDGINIINEISCNTLNGPAIQLSISCSPCAVSTIIDLYRNEENISKTIQIIDVQKPLDSRQGYGRLIELKNSRTIREVIENIKTLTGLKYIRLALANNKTIDSSIKTIAVCAGSGSSVFSQLRNVDVQLTGELTHHTVLDAVHRGTTVILCDHTNTERGFLNVIKKHFEQIWNSNEIKLLISERDRDPLEIV